jgi:hypothetical protein
MIANRNNRIILIFTIILLTVSQSCDFDQVESKYSDFKAADKDGLFDKGWIPTDLVFYSMSNIYQRTNLDLNSCVFNYTLSKLDLNSLKEKIKPSSIKFEKLHRIEISSDWIKSVNKLNHYYFVCPSKIDTVYLAVDENNNRIYGWRE